MTLYCNQWVSPSSLLSIQGFFIATPSPASLFVSPFPLSHTHCGCFKHFPIVNIGWSLFVITLIWKNPWCPGNHKSINIMYTCPFICLSHSESWWPRPQTQNEGDIIRRETKTQQMDTFVATQSLLIKIKRGERNPINHPIWLAKGGSLLAQKTWWRESMCVCERAFNVLSPFYS